MSIKGFLYSAVVTAASFELATFIAHGANAAILVPAAVLAAILGVLVASLLTFALPAGKPEGKGIIIMVIVWCILAPLVPFTGMAMTLFHFVSILASVVVVGAAGGFAYRIGTRKRT